jgi:hypothetical protein
MPTANSLNFIIVSPCNYVAFTLELYLVIAKFLMALVILLPFRNHPEYLKYLNSNWSSLQAASPWIFLVVIQSFSLVFMFWKKSIFKLFRITGSIFAMLCWSWIVSKLYLTNYFGSALTPFAITSFFASGFLLWCGFRAYFFRAYY